MDKEIKIKKVEKKGGFLYVVAEFKGDYYEGVLFIGKEENKNG
jgi:hypothetical protein